jgi:hypothetical protein
MRSAREKSTEGPSPSGQRVTLQRAEASSLQPLLTLQQTVGNQAVLRLLAGRLQPKLKVSHPADAHEQEADWIAEQVVRGRSELPVQRKCAHCAVSAPCNECAEEEEVQRKIRGQSPASGSAIIQRAANNSETTSARTPETVSASASRLIVEDDTRQLVAGQMHKSEFLALLRDHVCTTADEALARVGRTTKGCPYIERWLTHYADKDSQYIERALRRYVPEAAGARAVRDYIPAVSGRVRRGVEIWATTGRITGVPEGVSLDQPGSEPGPSSSQTTSAASPAGPISRKAREGSTEGIGDATEIKDQLRAGRSLDGGVRARMESAFGLSFSDVRVHTDHKAAQLSDGLKAHAFTIGQDIAFSAGAYRPGTLVGDALIAHELAHTVQQGGARPSAQEQQKEAAENGSLEHDADMSAANAAVSLWAKGKSLLTNTARNVMPRLRSGLQLQRCSTDTCPEGYYWQVVNSAVIASGCVCTWRCLQGQSSGPSISDPNRRPPLNMPGTRQSVGVTSAPQPGGPSTCLCLPLKDSEGNVISTPQMRGADQDYTGAAAAAAGMTQGPYRPPQTTDRRPPAADIRPAGGGGGGRPPAGGTTGVPPVRPAAPPTQAPAGGSTPGTGTTPAPGPATPGQTRTQTPAPAVPATQAPRDLAPLGRSEFMSPRHSISSGVRRVTWPMTRRRIDNYWSIPHRTREIF